MYTITYFASLLGYAQKREWQLKRRGRNVVCVCPFRRNEYRWRIVVIIEGSLSDVALAARVVHHNAVVGHARGVDTAVFARLPLPSSQLLAADFAFRFLAGELRGIERLANALRFQSRDNQARKAITPAAGPGGYSPL